MSPLDGRRVAIVGGASGIGAAIAARAAEAGAEVIVAGRRVDRLTPPPGGRVAAVDLAVENSVAEFAAEVGPVDVVVSLAADHANGPVVGLDPAAVHRALDAKVVGPLLLVKHLAPRMPDDGVVVLFSGVASRRPSPGLVVMATGNRAVEGLVDALAVELAPIRVVGVSPGIVDSGAWDGLGAERDGFFAGVAAANPARRVGTTADLASATMFAIENPFLTGTTLHVDGGGRLA